MACNPNLDIPDVHAECRANPLQYVHMQSFLTYTSFLNMDSLIPAIDMISA